MIPKVTKYGWAPNFNSKESIKKLFAKLAQLIKIVFKNFMKGYDAQF